MINFKSGTIETCQGYFILSFDVLKFEHKPVLRNAGFLLCDGGTYKIKQSICAGMVISELTGVDSQAILEMVNEKMV